MDLAINALRLSGYFLSIAQHAIGQSSINQGKIIQIILTLPPKQEQHRIVAKVDELMELCDELEEQQKKRDTVRVSMNSACLHELTAPEPDKSQKGWTRARDHFDLLYDTPQNVVALRQSILQLAVMGKLSCPQHTDSPIEKLIEHIIVERKALGMTKKEEVIFENEIDASKNSIHRNCVKFKTRVFCDFITKGTTPSKSELIPDGEVPFLKVYNIVNNQLDFNYRPIFISRRVHQTKLKRSKIYPGDVVMNIVGPPLGKVAIITDQYSEWNMNQALAVFRPLAGIYNRYIYYMLSTNSVLEFVLSEVKGTAGQDNLSLEQCRDLLIPIPSIEEQHRIVAKLDELMALCDNLESKLRQSLTSGERLMKALVDQVTSA